MIVTPLASHQCLAWHFADRPVGGQQDRQIEYVGQNLLHDFLATQLQDA
ncbi:hypothetical protein ALQ02_200069 [Pseudomonas savastanoi pv. phaseolicola]|nr:hypothetical protein ALQ02_200069 [Pseudomonas savastanoi pv. phaseolicola]